MGTTSRQLGRGRSVWLTSPRGLSLLALLLLGLGGAVLLAVRSSGGMTASTSSTTQRQVVTAGNRTRLSMVVEIRSAPSDRLLLGRLLTKTGDTTYRRTAQMVRIRWSSATRVVMGQKGDIRQDAVLQVDARTLGRLWFLARTITILTGYVMVQ